MTFTKWLSKHFQLDALQAFPIGTDLFVPLTYVHMIHKNQKN